MGEGRAARDWPDGARRAAGVMYARPAAAGQKEKKEEENKNERIYIYIFFCSALKPVGGRNVFCFACAYAPCCVAGFTRNENKKSRFVKPVQ